MVEKNVVKKEGFDLACNRCKYKWRYRGESDWYTSCPRCKMSVSVRNRKRELGMKVD